MILKSTLTKTSGNIVKIDDMRKLSTDFYFNVDLNPYFHKVSEITGLSKSIYKQKEFSIIIPEIACSCNNYSTTENILDNFCIHARNVLKNKFANKISPLSKLLLSEKNNTQKLFTAKSDENTFILIGIIPNSKWINVYLYDNFWKNFRFNFVQKRWAFNQTPQISEPNTKLINFAFSKIL